MGDAVKGVRTSADARGRFGEYGGRYVPETLIAALEELGEAYPRISSDADFRAEFPVTNQVAFLNHANVAPLSRRSPRPTDW